MARKTRTRKQRRAILRGAAPKGGWYEERVWSLARMGYTSYAAYLASDRWAGIRLRVMARCGGVCEVCRGRPAGTVHHRGYGLATMTGQRLDSLVACCHGCHRAAEFDGERKVSLDEANRRLSEMARR